MPTAISLPSDPSALIRSRPYRVLLVIASVIGLIVSVASWGFLELIHGIQQWVYKDLPSGLGFDTVPMWWPLPVLGLAGVIIALLFFFLVGLGIVFGAHLNAALAEPTEHGVESTPETNEVVIA